MIKRKRTGIWIMVALIILVSAGFIWLDNPVVRLVGQEEKLRISLVIVAICLGILLFDELLVRLWEWLVSLRFVQQLKMRAGVKPEQLEHEQHKCASGENVKEIRCYLRQRYGRRWATKIRILVLTGTVSEVEQLTPGLTSQLWQEDKGTLLLWGGDLNAPAETEWLKALRKLRYRPADGLVWVTSAFDRLSAPGLPTPSSAPSDSAMDTLAYAISQRMAESGWRLPLYLWSLHPRAAQSARQIAQAAGCLLPAGCSAEGLAQQLQMLSAQLIDQGILQICDSTQHNFLLTLADQLIREPESLSRPLSIMLNSYRPLPLAGIVFSSLSTEVGRSVRHCWSMDKRWEVLPESVCSLPAALRPRPLGIRWQKITAFALASLMTLWGAWMLVSFIGNRSLISQAQQQIMLAAQQKQPLAGRLQALLALQKTLDRLQYHSGHGVPWRYRAGLSQNAALLAVLWSRYAESAQPLLRDAAAARLQQQLSGFAALPPGSPLREQMASATRERLKRYLMLARPERMDAAWFSRSLLQDWPQRAGISESEWQGVAPTLLTFYAASLRAHPQWRWPVDEHLLSQSRALLVRLEGARNSESSLYQKMLAEVAHLYMDMRLEDMTGDTDASRLFTATDAVPGMFTRQAWEQAVRPAIKKVIKERREELDWVLTDSTQKPRQDVSPDALEKRLTERYFADFGGAWLAFLNGLRWVRATTLSDAIDQLTLMADVRQSPLVALMNTLNVQGRTGEAREAVADSLVKSAKELLNGNEKEAIERRTGAQGPLDSTFGPVLALMDKNSAGGQAQSLQAYLTRITQVRLRLQQASNAADPQAMTQALAQSVFQGKAVDLTEIRDYGSLIAAGLGQEWSGFGRTVFVEPMEQAWQQVLAPAADSLNASWQQAVVNDWNSAFGGRYPFSNTSSEVSLPLLAKYLNTDSGRIAQFLQTRLRGVLRREGSHWVPDAINAQGLTFNPSFLAAVNTLSHISDVVFINGEAGLHFELRPGTAAGVMQSNLVIDGQKLIYVNQMPTWTRFSWPADTVAPGASLSWISTQAGTRQYADMPGAWGWIRLLERASVTDYPGAGSSYSLRWKAQDGRNLNYTLRTEAGEGPLVLLKLRRFRLPETIFSVEAVARDPATGR
ncbi:ImcF-related family protein [Intestinirhabdus alba]|uniref:Type VI secretion protein VasK n=1 Tax=Intestinirhabdus alba TaxID=2899544 RepID=A0A6L6IPC2_9ENTR|nr:ImcF-related family protein [Intestinirhabdus alba]MTH48722.1 type VI secretion protein VasK [Intestinirhabdus alba]